MGPFSGKRSTVSTTTTTTTTTKLPLCIFTVVFINVFFYNMSSSVAYSFLPHLMKEFGATELKTGYYAGMTASSVFVGRLFFSMLWGYLTDTIGKRTSSILTGSLLLICTGMFGFSKDFYWSITMRFLQGCAMGQVIVSKAILAHLCGDDTISLGMSVVMTALVTGQAIGPSIGGFTAFPGSQYPKVFGPNNLFTKFCILLLNMVICIGLFAGVVLTVCYVPEDTRSTPQCAKGVVSYGAIDGIQDDQRREEISPAAENQTNFDSSMDLDDSMVDFEKEDDGHPTKQLDEKSPSLGQHRKPVVSFFHRFYHSKFVLVLREKECVCCSILYGMFALTDVVFIEMFPVLAATDPAYKGLGFTTQQIGTVLMTVSLVLVTVQLTLLPKLNRKVGSKRLLTIGSILLAFLCPLLPSISAIRNRVAMWACLLLLVFLIRACVFTSYLSLNILVNNSVGPSLFGSANGVAMTIASLGRLIGPFVFGSLFSWSLTNVKGVTGNKEALGFPLNQYFIFVLLSGWSLGIAVLTTRLPTTLDYKKMEPN